MTHDQAREGTPLWEQPEVIEKAARALFDNDYGGYTPEFRESVWDDMGGSEPSEERADYVIAARAVLAAVLPEVERHAKADILREAADDVRTELGNETSGHTSTYSVRRWLTARADRIEKKVDDRG